MGSQKDKNFFKSNSEVYCMIATWLRLKLCFQELSCPNDSRVSWSQEELMQFWKDDVKHADLTFEKSCVQISPTLSPLFSTPHSANHPDYWLC